MIRTSMRVTNLCRNALLVHDIYLKAVLLSPHLFNALLPQYCKIKFNHNNTSQIAAVKDALYPLHNPSIGHPHFVILI